MQLVGQFLWLISTHRWLKKLVHSGAGFLALLRSDKQVDFVQLAAVPQHFFHENFADEAGAAGDENAFSSEALCHPVGLRVETVQWSGAHSETR